MRSALSYSQVAPLVVDQSEVEAIDRGDRGFGPLVRLLRQRESIDASSVLRLVSDATEADLLRIEAGTWRPTVDWVRAYSMATTATFTFLFDVWDREGPEAADRMTVAEATSMVMRLAETTQGVVCPCCGALAKVRRRSLNRPIASFVSWLAQNYSGTPLDALRWVDATPKLSRGGDYAKAAYWQLAKREPGEAPLWSPTESGRRWAFGLHNVHRHAVLFRGRVLRFEGDPVAISEVSSDIDVRRGQEQAPCLPGLELHTGSTR